MTRRKLFAMLAGLPFVGKLVAVKPPDAWHSLRNIRPLMPAVAKFTAPRHIMDTYVLGFRVTQEMMADDCSRVLTPAFHWRTPEDPPPAEPARIGNFSDEDEYPEWDRL